MRYGLLLVFLLFFSLTFCTKENNPGNEGDPSNLSIEITSVNHNLKEVELLANAQNAVQYQLYIGESAQAADENTNGFFRYTFNDFGMYQITVRAYGSSGRYIKASKQVEINSGQSNDTVSLNNGYFTPEEYEGYQLVWQDEFNASAINTDFWNFEIGTGNWGWGNNELEYYRAENAEEADGVLTIEARKENFSSSNYTSARLTTKGKQSFQYGRIDIRALLPEGKGLWPALWMLGNNISSVGWPDCGEIDIMEMIGGNENIVKGTAHWEYDGAQASSGGSRTLPPGSNNYAEAYHVFSLEWDAQFLRWFVDDHQYYELDITGADMSEFHQSQFFIFNVAVGGNWPGNPDASTLFPQRMKVDYVRVFQKN